MCLLYRMEIQVDLVLNFGGMKMKQESSCNFLFFHYMIITIYYWFYTNCYWSLFFLEIILLSPILKFSHPSLFPLSLPPLILIYFGGVCIQWNQDFIVDFSTMESQFRYFILVLNTTNEIMIPLCVLAKLTTESQSRYVFRQKWFCCDFWENP